ncbi:1 4-alpha-glucan-branching enzyme 3 chloroplastic/amyloplastic [Phtheirospermum japonicum]|uniref:1 4-alpha-glucan-branching enzyme 3 chloroplastic/amyloplastic n=1 Tax=Phtheirospermum japonicum TaxID=374723 RepID=A0A830CZB6_9LAMI|nr:1 4-alpha-glucan-branching enzyme 3 chloroplastic/amyloplastic [Phtheirospermum japonicum]
MLVFVGVRKTWDRAAERAPAGGRWWWGDAKQRAAGAGFGESCSSWWMVEYQIDGFYFQSLGSMMYTHNGFATFTGDMKEYCNQYVDREVLLYIMLVNEILHEIHPNIVTIAKDLAIIVSIRGRVRKPIQNGEKDKFLKKDSEEETIAEQQQQLGFLENLLQIVYQPFTWFGIIYCVLWSGAYVVFQWVLHACMQVTISFSRPFNSIGASVRTLYKDREWENGLGENL